MFVEGGRGWTPSWESPPRRPQLTKRQEKIILWCILVNALLLLIAPIGGATIIEAAMELIAGR